jgi:pimeloyl-ACP methyl ester carboxylesterase
MRAFFSGAGVLAVVFGSVSIFGAGCGSDDTTSDNSQTSAGSDAGQDSSTGPATDSGARSDSGSSDADSGSPGDDGGALPDPNVDGPFAYAEKDATTTVAATSDSVAIHAAYPTAAGTYPLVIFAHGFQIPASNYYDYLKRLASFGYVALTVSYADPLLSGNNTNQAADLIGGIDWAKTDTTFGSRVDTTTVGMSGHSLGGKLALLAATTDTRVKAAIVLDPVDGGQGTCTAPSCIEVGALMPSLHIPTGFLGETTDSSGGEFGMPCAPAADNYTTFYAQTNSPSLEVTVTGAQHMSFVDSITTCGTVCSFCTAGTASNAQVTGIAYAYVAAFYERYLRGNTGYDAYLTGAQAQARYVTTNEITILSK